MTAIMLLAGLTVYGQQDVTDSISAGPIPLPTANSPDAEQVPNAIDNNDQTKYLNFDILNCGLALTPVKSGTVVGAITLTTANDATERDPASYLLSGSNDSIDGPWTDIASGNLSLSDTRFWYSGRIYFDNDTAYDHYRLLFPTVKNAGAANSMQIAEIEIIEKPANGWPPEVDAGPDQFVRLPNTTTTMNPTATDPDSATLTYSWVELPGNPGTVNFSGTENQADATVILPPIKGVYQLRLDVTDESNNEANDVISIRVWDPAVEDILVAHWKFNEGSGNIAEDSTASDGFGNDQGIIDHRPEGEDPNWTEGWIPSEAPNNYALEFYNFGYVRANAAPDGPDPNFTNLQYSITIACWMNAVDWDGNRRFLQKGNNDDQYRFLAENGRLVLDLAGVGRLETDLPSAGTWHHVAGTYDGSDMKIYVDGFEVATMEASGLIGITQDPLYIGTKSENVDPLQHPGDYFKGKLDDVRVYSYALSSTEIEALAAMGQNAPPVVTIAQPDDLVLSVQDFIQMDATVFDVNGPGGINYSWTASGPAAVTFDPGDTVEDPKAVFTQAGTYVLRLTVNDGQAGMSGDIYDEVTVNVTNPTCADVIALGLNLFGDSNGDCRITLVDFAAFAANWLRCVDPLDPSCENPFEQE